jgi:hypothetical protein
MEMTGTHLGSTTGPAPTVVVGMAGSMSNPPPGAGTSVSIDGSRFYATKYLNPVQYRAWQAQIWKTYRAPRVDVGELEQVEKTIPPKSRLPDAPPDRHARAPDLPKKCCTDDAFSLSVECAWMP